ncbi:MAG TPA: Clp protease N-terminal domain-containing protein [Streptosporangiaceae bacterium]|nr:Clp protease N-terminal domain-containing protein [Streptosporangiaceae bacterium]
MFERFTDRARRVVVLAQEHARLLNHQRIGTEHLLLGLIREQEGVAARALVSLGIDVNYAEQRVFETVGRGEQSQSGHLPFTPAAKQLIERSLREALGLGHNYIGTEHLLLGLIWLAEDPTVTQIILPRVDFLSTIRNRVIQLLFGYEGPHGRPFRDLTALAEHPAGLGPVVGRQQEIDQVISVLEREPAVSALLMGERGVGTSTVACGVARAVARRGPAPLAGKRICELSLLPVPGRQSTDNIAGELVQTVLSDISRLRDTILFVERACTTISVDNERTTVLRLLRPMIMNGDLQAIAAITPAEQRQYMAADVEFSRAFDTVVIDEMPKELVAVVLAELRDSYESRHQVAISDAAITAAIVLSMEHEPDQPLPGKAIALMDKSAAHAARRIVKDEQFTQQRQRIAELGARKDAAIDDQDWERARALRDEEKHQLKALDEQRATWRSEWKNVPAHRIVSVTAQDVAEAVAEREAPPARDGSRSLREFRNARYPVSGRVAADALARRRRV